MPLSPINLHYGKHELGKFNVHIIQIGEFLPEDNLFEYINSKEFQRKRQAKIFQKLDELLPSADKKDIVIFPELIAPYSIIESLSQYAKNYCFIVCGMVYDELYHNRCAVIDTDGNVYWQFKSLIAPEEPEKVQLAHANLLNEPVSTFVNTPVGDFAVLICYSFSDIEILNELREKVDSLIVICMNRAAKDYLSEASRIARDYYFHIILCNVAEFGGSAICGPFKHNLVAKSLGAGEGILDREIDLREFREAMRDPARYRRKAGRTYKTIPAGFHRKLNWYLGTHEACIESMFYDWERNRESTIELCEDISRNIDLDIADMNDCIDNREAETGIVTMKSLYLLEDLFEQVSNLVCVKELIKSKGFFTTERSFIDVNEFEYTFMKWEDFITQYRLIPNENELKAKLEEVAKCCRDSCIGYGRHTRKCNTVSLKFTRNIMLITCAEIDKSTLEDKDVTIVARVAPFRFNYTHLERPPKPSGETPTTIKPSKETYLNYEVLKNVQDKNVLLHFHHENILDFAWKIPIIYRNNEMDVVFHYKNRIVPSIDGRNVRIKDFTEKLIKKFKNANVDTVIGVRHGSWTIGDTFSDCLAQANGADDEARIYRNQNMDRIVDHINNVNEKIKYVWNKGNCRQSKGITRSKT